MMRPCSLAWDEVDETSGKFGFMVPPPEEEVEEIPDEGLLLPLWECAKPLFQALTRGGA